MKTNVLNFSGALAAGLTLYATAAAGQPVVTGTSGEWAHRSSVTVQGSGFGSKATAAPVVWDDCSGNAPADKWSGWLPSRGDAQSIVQYRSAPFRNVGAPHGRVNRFLAGATSGPCGYDCGYNVMVYKIRQGFSRPAYSYITYYLRADPAWVFGGDNNFKMGDWAAGSEPYTGGNWYLTQMPAITSAMDANGAWAAALPSGTVWGGAMTNLHSQWVKVEIEARWSDGSDGRYPVLGQRAASHQLQRADRPTERRAARGRHWWICPDAESQQLPLFRGSVRRLHTCPRDAGQRVDVFCVDETRSSGTHLVVWQ